MSLKIANADDVWLFFLGSLHTNTIPLIPIEEYLFM